MKFKISKIFRFRKRANRKYKDELFRFIFQDKRDLLSLYNAVNGTNYQDPEDLEINTLENVIYLKMKNDLSFLVGASMNLYEHQSTWNPNMPLRGLLYFAELYERYINSKGYRLSGNTCIPLPFPNYIVFYNGLEREAEREYLRKGAIEEGLEQGIAQGMILGGFGILASLVDDGILSAEQAAKRAEDKQEEFLTWYQEQKKEKK